MAGNTIKTGDCVWFASFYHALEAGQQKQPNGHISRIDWGNRQVCVLHKHQDNTSEATWLEFSDLNGNWDQSYNCWMMWDW